MTVTLIDHMGDDLSIVNAARVSLHKHSEVLSDADAKLIRYLMANRHSSPFEHVTFSFRIRTPVGVAREFMRHRIACLTADAELHFDLPNALRRGKRARVTRSVGAIYKRWHKSSTKGSAILQQMHLRSCNEETGEIVSTHIRNIWSSGIQPVYRVTLANGYALTMTANHRCLTKSGWHTLEEALQLRLSTEGRVTWSATAPQFAVNGVLAYRDPTWLSEQRAEGKGVAAIASSAGVSYHTIRAWLRKHKLQYTNAEKSIISLPNRTGRKRQKRNWVMPEEQRAKLRELRSGKGSNFWKGGITKDRALIGAWTTRIAKEVHAEHDYLCLLCQGTGSTLVAHHLDPVWHNRVRAFDRKNLITLCTACHKLLHARKLELELLHSIEEGKTIEGFFESFDRNYCPPLQAPRGRPIKLLRGYSPVVNVEHLGEQPTYDVEVTGPWHNFVANGLIVHNSFNEESTRYVQMRPDFYLPAVSDVRTQVGKPGHYTFESVEPDLAADFIADLDEQYKMAYAFYEHWLAKGIARELVRNVLPLGILTEFVMTANFRSLTNFLSLRTAPDALLEIRREAKAIEYIIDDIVPVAYQAWVDGGRKPL